MADLAVQAALPTGLVVAFTAVNASDAFVNDGKTVLRVRNDGVGSINVVIDDPGSRTPLGATQFNPDVTVAVAAGAEKTLGPFPPGRFNDVAGKVQVSYSGQTSVTAAVVRVSS